MTAEINAQDKKLFENIKYNKKYTEFSTINYTDTSTL